MIAKLTIELLAYWQVGSGRGRGGDADALVLKGRHELPYLPGKSLKGLLREGLQVCEDAGVIDSGRTNKWMGAPATKGSCSIPGLLSVESAVLAPDEALWLASAGGAAARAALYDTVASTKLDKNGMAKTSTLRTIEICVPVKLHACVRGPDTKDGERWFDDLQEACSVIRSLGAHRHRGLGRCRFALCEEK
jgi:hypothetical protein